MHLQMKLLFFIAPIRIGGDRRYTNRNEKKDIHHGMKKIIIDWMKEH